MRVKSAVSQPVRPRQAVPEPVAGRRFQAPTPFLQRRCACGKPGGMGAAGDECEDCRKERQHLLQRRGGIHGAATVPPMVQEVLRSPGQPLDPRTRSFMEPRFRHSFQSVRVHNDERAAESARSIGAHAFAAGNQIVFGQGHYVPSSPAGRRLLAHELAHVVQQSSASVAAHDAGALQIAEPRSSLESEADRVGETIAASHSVAVAQRGKAALHGAWNWKRAGIGALTGGVAGGIVGGLLSIPLGPAAFFIGLGAGALLGGLIGGLTGSEESTSSVQAPTGPNDCGMDQHRKIFPAVHQSLAWLGQAVSRLTAYTGNPAASANQPVRQMLVRHFRSDQAPIPNHVLGRLQRIRAEITTRHPFTIECHPASDPGCNAAAAYVPGGNPNMIVFCPSFFASDDPAWHSETLIHEFAHALTAGVDITDRAYRSDRLYSPAIVSGITTAEALTNADSYAVFTREVATGEMVSVGGPVDPFSGCTAAWIQPVSADAGSRPALESRRAGRHFEPRNATPLYRPAKHSSRRYDRRPSGPGSARL